MVDPIVDMKWLAKVLMDGHSGLNIMYAKTLDAMGIDRARRWLTEAPSHGIMLGKQAMPLGQIGLPITFGGPSNYRMEPTTPSWDDHAMQSSWSSQDSVVGSVEPNHFEGEGLYPKVRRTLEGDG